MKRFIVILLCAAICLSSFCNIFAVDLEQSAENVNSGTVSTMQRLYQQAVEIANARGITLMPYEQVVQSAVISSNSHVSNEVSYDYPGKDVLMAGKDPASVEKNIPSEIRGGTSQSNAQVISVSSQTYDSIATAGEVDWFTFSVNGNGAHNLYTTGTTDTKAELYKRTWTGSYVLIDSNDDGGSGVMNFRLEVGLEMNVDYYVKVSAYGDKTGAYTLVLEENVDSIHAINGGSWTYNVSTPDPDGAYYSVDKIVYLPVEEVEGYYNMITRDEIKEAKDHILSLSYNAAVAYVMAAISVGSAVAEFIVSELASFSFPDLTDLELDSIASAGGMGSDGQFTSGIVVYSITGYTIDGFPVFMNTYESWSGPMMYGEARYRGTFDLTDRTPMWR